MTLNARFILKCALRTARLTYVRCGFWIRPYIHIGVARGGGRGVGWRAYPPPCGQLTRCFSAVAELLVCRPINGVQCVLSYTYIIFMSYQKLDSYCQTFDCNVGVHGS